MFSDRSGDKAKFGGFYQCADQSIHHVWCSSLHTLQQRPGIYRGSRHKAVDAESAYIEPGAPWESGGEENDALTLQPVQSIGAG